jgi:hypothetical protein
MSFHSTAGNSETEDKWNENRQITYFNCSVLLSCDVRLKYTNVVELIATHQGNAYSLYKSIMSHIKFYMSRFFDIKQNFAELQFHLLFCMGMKLCLSYERKNTNWWCLGTGCWGKYEGVFKSFRTESITKSTTTNTRWEATQRVMAAKLTRLAHKIAIQLHVVAESCTISSSRSRQPVRKILDTPSDIHLYNQTWFFKNLFSDM